MAASSIVRMIRPLLPNVPVKIRHTEPNSRLWLGLRHHFDIIMGGAAAYEPESVSIFKAWLHPGDAVLDIGANVGFHTVLLSRLVGSHGTVHAYEPDPDNVALLSRNLSENHCGNVQVHEVALSSYGGKSPFSRDFATGMTGRLGTQKTPGAAAFGSGHVTIIEAETSTVDREVARLGIRPAVIKVDVAGSEYNLLLGAVRTLKEHRPFVICHASAPDAASQNADGDSENPTLGLLRVHGYSLYDAHSGRPLRRDRDECLLLGVPNERTDDRRLNGLLRSLGRHGGRTTLAADAAPAVTKRPH